MSIATQMSLETRVWQHVRAGVERLEGVWTLLGLTADMRAQRLGEVMNHVVTLMDSVAEQEEAARDEILANIDKYRFSKISPIFISTLMSLMHTELRSASCALSLR